MHEQQPFGQSPEGGQELSWPEKLAKAGIGPGTLVRVYRSPKGEGVPPEHEDDWKFIRTENRDGQLIAILAKPSPDPKKQGKVIAKGEPVGRLLSWFEEMRKEEAQAAARGDSLTRRGAPLPGDARKIFRDDGPGRTNLQRELEEGGSDFEPNTPERRGWGKRTP